MKRRALKRIAVGFLIVVLGLVVGLVVVYVYRASTFQMRVNGGGGSYAKWVVRWRHASEWAWAAWAIVALGILMLPVFRRTTATVPASIRRISHPWAFDLGVSVVVLAAILLVADVRRETFDLPMPTPVLVAKQLIPKGTPGLLVATNTMYAPTTLPLKEVEDGAIADPSYLNGQAAAADILPGEQIVASDFGSPIAPTVVLVATEPIRMGTPGSIVLENGMYRATVTPRPQREVSAISDPSDLRGRASVADINLGQQLTEANFPPRG